MFASSVWRNRHEGREVHDASRGVKADHSPSSTRDETEEVPSLRPDQVAVRDKIPCGESKRDTARRSGSTNALHSIRPTKADQGPSSWKRRLTRQPLRTYRDQNTYPLGHGSQAGPHLGARNSAGSCESRERYRRCAERQLSMWVPCSHFSTGLHSAPSAVRPIERAAKRPWRGGETLTRFGTGFPLCPPPKNFHAAYPKFRIGGD
jgi:hypothetical protein